MNRASTRLLAGLLLAALAAGAVAWLLATGPGHGTAASGSFRVEVVGRGGPLFNGTLAADGATPLSLLQLAGQAGGFPVAVRGSGCTGAYVEAVAGEREAGAAGWVYRIKDGGGWRTPGVGAACPEAGLRDGDTLRWEWSERE